MKTAEEYFQSKNGGKPSSLAVEHGEYITATWAVILMEEYAQHVADEQSLEFALWMADKLVSYSSITNEWHMKGRDFEFTTAELLARFKQEKQ